MGRQRSQHENRSLKPGSRPLETRHHVSGCGVVLAVRPPLDHQGLLNVLDPGGHLTLLHLHVPDVVVRGPDCGVAFREHLLLDGQRLELKLDRAGIVALLQVLSAEVHVARRDTTRLLAVELSQSTHRGLVKRDRPGGVPHTGHDDATVGTTVCSLVGPSEERADHRGEQAEHPPPEHRLVDRIDRGVSPLHLGRNHPPDVVEVGRHRGLGLGAVDRRHDVNQHLAPTVRHDAVPEGRQLARRRHHNGRDTVDLGHHGLVQTPRPFHHQRVVKRPGDHHHFVAPRDLRRKVRAQRLKRHCRVPGRLINLVLVDRGEVEVVHRGRVPGRHHTVTVLHHRVEHPESLGLPGVADEIRGLCAVPPAVEVDVALPPAREPRGRRDDDLGGNIGRRHDRVGGTVDGVGHHCCPEPLHSGQCDPDR
eukprot:m.128189 g.128189  ORF g.128189 m.128189 type:complete len:420 (+) comp22279_c0_seq4:75-1334(+)